MEQDRGKESDYSEQTKKMTDKSVTKSAASASQKAKAKAGGKSAGKVPYERPRGAGVRSISDLMPEVGRTAFRRFGFIQSSVVSRWPEIVGSRHARVCSPEMLRFPVGEKSDGTLHLVVMPAHAPMIQHVIPEIIARVNRFFGYKAVGKVKMRQGEVKPLSSKKPIPIPASKSIPVPQELGQSLDSIQDPELRAALESLARSIYAKDQEKQ